MSSAREAALLALCAMEKQKAWSDGAMKKILGEGKLDRRDAALATQLCFGVLQNRTLLDFYLQHYSTVKLEKMEHRVLGSLRLGLYQMLFLTKIPLNAAVNESVELTKKHCKNPRAAGLVNGVLRNLARHLDDLPTLDRSDPAAYLALRYSHPEWFVREMEERLSPQETEALLEWDNGEPPVTAQVNTCRASAAEVRDLLEAEGVTAAVHPWLPDCLVLSGTGNLEERSAYGQGLFYVQDPAARLAVLAAGLTAGERVLDACAAPGGKSFAAAIAIENRGEILSCDIHSHKKALIEAGARRMGLTCITAHVADGKKFRPEWQDGFDVVLADVPCSGLGVLRKKPEIREKRQEELADLPRAQGDILSNVSRYVKPGGVLLYSTCTLRQAENEEVVSAFLTLHRDYRREGFSLPGPVGEVPEGQMTLWPQRLGTDGFFLAKFRRAKPERGEAVR